MTEITAQAQRMKAAALKAKSEANEWGYDTDAFHDEATPDAVIQVVEALEKAQQRIGELERSHKTLRETMAGIHNTIRTDGGYMPLVSILNASKRAYEESAAAAGIQVIEGEGQ